MKTFLLASIFFFCCRYSIAQDNTELVTDRPDQTESANIVPIKSLQIETGALIEWMDSDHKTVNFNSTLLRYGVTDNFELRLGFGRAVDITSENGKDNKHHYWQPIDCGFKVFISEQDGCIPQTAFIGHLSYQLDHDNDGFDGDHISPSFRFAFANDLGGPVSLGYNLGMHWDDVEYSNRQKASLYFSFVTGLSINDRLACFAEIYGDLSDDQPDALLFDSGLTFLLRENIQLDLSGGIGLNPGASDGFISAGLTWRIPE